MGCSYETDWVDIILVVIIRNFISHITYYSLMFFIAYALKGQVHVFTGRVKNVSHSLCWTSAILKYFCTLGCLEIYEQTFDKN